MPHSKYSILVNLKELVIEGHKVPLNSWESFSLDLEVFEIGNVEKQASAIKYTFELSSDRVNKEGRGTYNAELTISHIKEEKEYNFTQKDLTIDVMNENATFKGRIAISEAGSDLKELIKSQFKEIKFDNG